MFLLTRREKNTIIVQNRTTEGGRTMYFWDEHKGITRYYEILKSTVCEK